MIREKVEKIKSTNPQVVDYLQRRINLGVDESRCQYYILRKQRYCTHRAQSNIGDVEDGKYCTEHLIFVHKNEDRGENSLELKIRRNCEWTIENIIQHLEDNLPSASNKRVTIVKEHADIETKKKMRVSAPKRMANPFSVDLTPQFNTSINWSEVYSNSFLPLHIDVGCAKGACIEKLSMRDHRRSWNHLGLEIRSALIDECKHRQKDTIKRSDANSSSSNPQNLHFIHCNFAASAEDILKSLPPNSVRMVSFQFPDPWRKSKHNKRRIVQSNLLNIIAKYLQIGSCIYISTDCEYIANDMHHTIVNCGYFVSYASLYPEGQKDSLESKGGVENSPSGCIMTPGSINLPSVTDQYWESNDGLQWLKYNPVGEPSERELVCEVDWRRGMTSKPESGATTNTKVHSANVSELLRQNLTREMLLEVEETFRMVCDENNILPQNKLEMTLKSLGMSINDLVDSKETIAITRIDLDQFIQYIIDCTKTHKWAIHEMNDVYNLFDRDGNGAIDPQELKRVFFGLGENVSDAELIDQLREYDMDGDHEMALAEFYKMVNSTKGSDFMFDEN